MKHYQVGYTTGVFDLFHIGHLNILRKAKTQCDTLIVGVSSDELVRNYKNKQVVIPFEERRDIVAGIRYVDQVVKQDNMDKLKAQEKLHFDVVFVGDDWKNTPQWDQYEKEFNKRGVDVVYLPYTKETSSTQLRETLNIITGEGKIG
ncbi:adenylyltransferase/cytidyltransferase family protein [Niameybacter massiliensis]|uniref:adenylyltransferase/cytidyltransferase family protein n=1 Tax=Niameybacter massiliensis TaxID=1658108 RepID=UPI0006B62733|nr:adenylyltransferase/cytidyltransferase family protein [Niameybacter massiliensis]